MSIVGSALSIFDWLKDKLPIQDRVERWKNELDKLQRERSELVIFKKADKYNARIEYIDMRINQLNGLLKNKAGE